jgi:L-ascorbate metabolism protein UlaG (beta-lactamase superfamily)
VTDIRFLGQSCFELSDGEARVIVDPFLAPNNPIATVSADQLDATHVLITHGHADHHADAVAVAAKNDPPTDANE